MIPCVVSTLLRASLCRPKSSFALPSTDWHRGRAKETKGKKLLDVAHNRAFRSRTGPAPSSRALVTRLLVVFFCPYWATPPTYLSASLLLFSDTMASDFAELKADCASPRISQTVLPYNGDTGDYYDTHSMKSRDANEEKNPRCWSPAKKRLLFTALISSSLLADGYDGPVLVW